MIASLTGTVEHVGLDAAVIVVGGVGLAVQATPATLATLRVGEPARLATSLIVREDSLTLMGFETDDEREVFAILQTVSGIGPKVALAMLAVHTPDALRRAVAGEDLAALQRVPGIGKKGAQRIVLELGDKLGPPHGDGVAAATEAGAAQASTEVAGTDARTEPVVSALTGLGWPQAAAEQAVEAVVAAFDAHATDQAPGVGGGAGHDMDTAALLRAALQHLAGGGRGR